jgi:antitoxin (DNA-binding transcriptional repressor) of toxin-antitoxin stability system
MLRVRVEEIADQLTTLLERVVAGEEAILVDQDREVAPVVPPSGREEWLTKQFRDSLQVQGESLGVTVVRERHEERG